MKRTGAGTAMSAPKVVVRLVNQGHGGRFGSKLDGRVVEVRKLLRTDKDLSEIAELLGVSLQVLRRFIRLRNLATLRLGEIS